MLGVTNDALSDRLTDKVWSYTAEDIYLQATYYKLMYKEKN